MIEQSEKDILDAHGETIDGLELQPFSGKHSIIAREIGFRYPYVGEDAYGQWNQTNVYPGAERDVSIFFWIRSLGMNGEIFDVATMKRKLHWVHCNHVDALDEAFTFGEAHGFHNPRDARFLPAYLMMIRQIDAATEMQPKLAGQGGGDSGPKV